MKKIFFILILLIFFSLPLFALDWINLHQQASTQTLSKNPQSENELYIQGLVYLNEHKDNEAKEVFDKLISQNNNLFEARWGLAEVLRRKKALKQSQEILDQIIQTNPGFSPAYITLAYIKYTQTKFNEAAKLALKVIKQGPEASDIDNFSRAYLIFAGSKGLIASKGGPLSKLINGTQVLPNLKRAEKLRPDAPEVLFGLGNFYFLAPGIAGGNLDKAQDYLKRCLKKDPSFADAYVRLAQVYKAKNNAEQYELYLKKAKAIDPLNELLNDELSGECKFNCQTVEE
ncbi:MAG: tetratricopeptide repeat protein [Candidatus Omnitrophica bacterium]|nr:tetratricopeptide repeat protein [Candidatus Omnitrophota bacterium]